MSIVHVQVSNSSDPNVPWSLEYRYTGYQIVLTCPGHGAGVQVGTVRCRVHKFLYQCLLMYTLFREGTNYLMLMLKASTKDLTQNF